MKQRNHAFDLLCGLCILRMMTLHISGFCGFRGDYWVAKMMVWTFFFMSFFFFKAGYFNKTVSGHSWEYVKDRTRRLLVPYLSWTLIGNVLFFGLLLCSEPLLQQFLQKRFSWDHLWLYSRPYGNAPLWFLFSFYVAYLAMHFIGKVRGLRWVIVTFPFISYWLYKEGNPLWMGLNNVFLGIFFFFLGRLWRWVMNWSAGGNNSVTQVQKHWTPRRLLLIGISCCLLVAFIVLNQCRHGEYDMSLNLYVQHPDGAIVNTVLALCGTSGILLSLPQCRIPIFNYIGEHSMVFFVCHYPVLIAYKIVRRIFDYSVVLRWDDFIILSALVLVTCLWLVPKVEAVPWLSGRWPKR